MTCNWVLEDEKGFARERRQRAIVGRGNCVRRWERTQQAWCIALSCGWRGGCLWGDGGKCDPASTYRGTHSPTRDTGSPPQ